MQKPELNASDIWSCENTDYLTRKYVEYPPNFSANFPKQFSEERPADAD